MSTFSANPLWYGFMIIVLVGVVGYYAYGFLDRTGVETQTVSATVSGKQYTPPGTTYNTTIAGGRAWTQSSETPEVYAVMLKVDGETSTGYVEKELYATLQEGDRVSAVVRRTRFSHRLETVEILR